MPRKTKAEKEQERIDNTYHEFCEDYNLYQGRLLWAIHTGLLLQKQLMFTHFQGNLHINAFDNPQRFEFDVNGESYVVPVQLPISGDEYNYEFAQYTRFNGGSIWNLQSIINEIEGLQGEQQKMVAKEKLRESALAKLSKE